MTHGRFVLLLEIPWLAVLWGWLFDGGAAAWFSAVDTASALGVWYGYQVTGEAREAREAAGEEPEETRPWRRRQ